MLVKIVSNCLGALYRGTTLPLVNDIDIPDCTSLPKELRKPEWIYVELPDNGPYKERKVVALLPEDVEYVP